MWTLPNSYVTLTGDGKTRVEQKNPNLPTGVEELRNSAQVIEVCMEFFGCGGDNPTTTGI